MDDNRLTLSIKDRLMLWNQYTILMALYPKERAEYEQKRDIVEQGYESHYDELVLGIDESGVSAETSRYVMDVLDMYRTLADTYDALADKSGIDQHAIVFPGFDGNNEADQMVYARFLVKDQRRWTEVLKGRPHFDLNSHMRTREMYERMLAAWRDHATHGLPLSKDALVVVLNARIHPSRRDAGAA